jgi:hypothetical protein
VLISSGIMCWCTRTQRDGADHCWQAETRTPCGGAGQSGDDDVVPVEVVVDEVVVDEGRHP